MDIPTLTLTPDPWGVLKPLTIPRWTENSVDATPDAHDERGAIPR